MAWLLSPKGLQVPGAAEGMPHELFLGNEKHPLRP
jgi:hypothetical protein